MTIQCDSGPETLRVSATMWLASPGTGPMGPIGRWRRGGLPRAAALFVPQPRENACFCGGVGECPRCICRSECASGRAIVGGWDKNTW